MWKPPAATGGYRSYNPEFDLSLAGKTIQNFHIHSKLGAGRVGVVYKARDAKLNRLVALKFLSSDLKSDNESVERFERELQAASALEHPHIGTIHEIRTTDDGQRFIVMAYYEGETLEEKLVGRPSAMDVNREAWGLKGVPTVAAPRTVQTPSQSEDPGLPEEEGVEEHERPPDNPVLPSEEAVSIARQIGEGLAAAHAEGIVHGDLKPSNVIVTKEGRTVILDFCLARLAGDLDLTQRLNSKTSAHYLSPERARGERVDHQTDIWSAGALLYEMISGRKAFPGDQDEAVISGILNADPEDIDNDDVRPILQKALVRDKFQRYSAAGDFVADLKALESDGADETPEPVAKPPTTPSKTVMFVAAAVIALVLIVFMLT